jgi:hypothetical protein
MRRTLAASRFDCSAARGAADGDGAAAVRDAHCPRCCVLMVAAPLVAMAYWSLALRAIGGRCAAFHTGLALHRRVAPAVVATFRPGLRDATTPLGAVLSNRPTPRHNLACSIDYGDCKAVAYRVHGIAYIDDLLCLDATVP